MRKFFIADRQQETINENRSNEFRKEIPEQPFSSEADFLDKDTVFQVSDIVKKLVKKGGGKALYYNHQIYWDMDLGEARQEASIDCITPEGWHTPVTAIEQIDVCGHAPGDHEYEIEVFVYEDEDDN